MGGHIFSLLSKPTTALGQGGSDWSRDLATLTFDLGDRGACGWCGLSSSIRVPSLKFVGFAVRKIWRTMCVSINGPGDLDFCFFFTLKLVCQSRQRWGPSFRIWAREEGTLWVLELITMYATDGRTKAKLLLPLPYGLGDITSIMKLNINTQSPNGTKRQKTYVRAYTDVYSIRIIWSWYTSWTVTFGNTTRRGLGGAAARPGPSSLYQT